jgi:tRNA A37 N6-isopentenylltransferase MiaA
MMSRVKVSTEIAKLYLILALMALRRVMTSTLSNNPLRTVVAVIGTTGVGKSNLAIALAESLKSRNSEGVVLSADSMQIYKGLDVITNKITKDEMKGVKHWGLDMVKPGEGNWEMGRWCLEADREVGHAITKKPLS